MCVKLSQSFDISLNSTVLKQYSDIDQERVRWYYLRID